MDGQDYCSPFDLNISGQRLGLRLDIDRAQNPPEMQGHNYAQTAPVFSPPKTPSKVSINILL